MNKYMKNIEDVTVGDIVSVSYYKPNTERHGDHEAWRGTVTKVLKTRIHIDGDAYFFDPNKYPVWFRFHPVDPDGSTRLQLVLFDDGRYADWLVLEPDFDTGASEARLREAAAAVLRHKGI